MEFWLAPNIGSADALRLFANPEEWTAARDAMSTFQTYIQLLEGDGADAALRNQCGPNICPAFLDAGVPAHLAAWGKQLAVEAGAVKPHDCEAAGTTAAALRAISRVREAGGEIKYFSIDESLVAASEDCHQSLADTVEFTARFIRTVRDQGVDAGVIEAYPWRPATLIAEYVSALAARGAAPAFLHVDVDRLRFELPKGKVPERQFRDDLALMQLVCRQHGLKYGLILWGNNATTDAEFVKDARTVLDIYKRLAPVDLDTLVIQSWQRADPPGQSPHWRIPSNLPESSATSLTHLLLEARDVWSGQRRNGASGSGWLKTLMNLLKGRTR